MTPGYDMLMLPDGGDFRPGTDPRRPGQQRRHRRNFGIVQALRRIRGMV